MHESSSPGAPTGRGTQEPSFIPALRFEALTPAYDAIVRLTTRERVVKRALLDAARLGPAVRLLDVGCGTGTFAIADGCWRQRGSSTWPTGCRRRTR